MIVLLSINITDNPLKTIIGKLPMKNRAGNFMVKRRGGGGFVVGPNGGKHLNLQSTSALSVLGIDKVRRYARIVRSLVYLHYDLLIISILVVIAVGFFFRNPRSPIKGHGPARSGKNLNFFGPPRSKADLDKELDSVRYFSTFQTLCRRFVLNNLHNSYTYVIP